MKKRMSLGLIVCLFGVFFALPVLSATKLIDYGFEDWTGNANTTPGYIFSSSASTYWNTHTNITEVMRTDQCAGRPAFSGSYYWHQNYSTAPSPCGGISGSVQGYNNIGFNGTYPNNSGDSTYFETQITSNTQVVRFYFRAVGNWKNQVATRGGSMGYLKFIRVWGGGGGGDYACAHLHLRVRDNTNTTFFLYDPATASFGTRYEAGVDLIDGNWHSVVFRVVRNNDTGASGNITQTVWFDDWNMTGPGTSRTTTSQDFENTFQRTTVTGNWSATYPSTFMGIDIDNLEIWDGIPDDSAPSTTPPAPEAWIE